MDYYHSLITEKSFIYLQELKRSYDFILIGGWAVFLFTRALKSKDIDIIVDYEVLSRLKEHYTIHKNAKLLKYEIVVGEFDIGIYVPYYSQLGIDIDQIKKYTTTKEGFKVPQIEILLLLKLYSHRERRGTSKGQKDELDIFSIIRLPEFDWKKYIEFVNRFGLKHYHEQFMHLLKTRRDVKELNINEQRMSKIRKRILQELNSITESSHQRPSE